MPTRGPRETNPAGRIYMCAKICAAAFDFFCHGTQDPYPTFLQVQHNLSLHTRSAPSRWSAISARLQAETCQQRYGNGDHAGDQSQGEGVVAAVMMGQARLQGRIARGEQISKLIREAAKRAAHFFGRRIQPNSLAPAFKPARGLSLSKVCGVRPK